MGSSNIKLVCIEDDIEMIDLFKLILGRHGYEILGAEGGRAGIELVKKEKPELILLDIMMPEMDGWEVYHQLKSDQSTSKIPVVVVTAKAQNVDRVMGLHIARVDDYITKPFNPNDLVYRVDRVLNRADV